MFDIKKRALMTVLIGIFNIKYKVIAIELEEKGADVTEEDVSKMFSKFQLQEDELELVDFNIDDYSDEEIIGAFRDLLTAFPEYDCKIKTSPSEKEDSIENIDIRVRPAVFGTLEQQLVVVSMIRAIAGEGGNSKSIGPKEAYDILKSLFVYSKNDNIENAPEEDLDIIKHVLSMAIAEPRIITGIIDQAIISGDDVEEFKEDLSDFLVLCAKTFDGFYKKDQAFIDKELLSFKYQSLSFLTIAFRKDSENKYDISKINMRGKLISTWLDGVFLYIKAISESNKIAESDHEYDIKKEVNIDNVKNSAIMMSEWVKHPTYNSISTLEKIQVIQRLLNDILESVDEKEVISMSLASIGTTEDTVYLTEQAMSLLEKILSDLDGLRNCDDCSAKDTCKHVGRCGSKSEEESPIGESKEKPKESLKNPSRDLKGDMFRGLF